MPATALRRMGWRAEGGVLSKRSEPQHFTLSRRGEAQGSRETLHSRRVVQRRFLRQPLQHAPLRHLWQTPSFLARTPSAEVGDVKVELERVDLGFGCSEWDQRRARIPAVGRL